jgi:hypothetical protein
MAAMRMRLRARRFKRLGVMSGLRSVSESPAF